MQNQIFEIHHPHRTFYHLIIWSSYSSHQELPSDIYIKMTACHATLNWLEISDLYSKDVSQYCTLIRAIFEHIKNTLDTLSLNSQKILKKIFMRLMTMINDYCVKQNNSNLMKDVLCMLQCLNNCMKSSEIQITVLYNSLQSLTVNISRVKRSSLSLNVIEQSVKWEDLKITVKMTDENMREYLREQKLKELL